MKTNLKTSLVIIFTVLAFNMATAQEWEWTSTSSIDTSRIRFTATVLPNGNVMIIGGMNGPELSSCEIYNSNTDTWTAAENLPVPRQQHTATLINDSIILVIGGVSTSNSLDHVDAYNINTNTWSSKSPLPYRPAGHSATLLENGKILIAGGWEAPSYDWFRTSVIYDYETDSYSNQGNFGASTADARDAHSSILLNNGNVLIAGGIGSSGGQENSFIYDVVNNVWSSAIPFTGKRASSSIIKLESGNLLLIGGYDWMSFNFSNNIQMFDAETETWDSYLDMATNRALSSVAFLPDGKILLAGGNNSTGSLSEAILIDTISVTETIIDPLPDGRYHAQAITLDDNRIMLISGMRAANDYYNDAIIYGLNTNINNSLNTEQNIQCYYKASSKEIAINFSGFDSESVKYSLVNSSGQTVRSKQIIVNTEETIFIKNTNFSSGIYFVNIQTGNRKITGKIIL